jgi:tRNA-splicing ligase RtcB
MRVIKKDNGVPIKMWTDGVPVEESALEQVGNVSTLPFIHSHVALMPDAHWGIGATVGSVIPTIGAVIPAAVGVDLGCGMCAVKTTLRAADLPDNLLAMRSAIEAAVPHGRTNNGGPGDRGAWGHVPKPTAATWYGTGLSDPDSLRSRFELLCHRHPTIAKSNHVQHLGTLGGGNHFVEVCLDTEDWVWVMLHSGSRGVGGRIGSYFIELAKEDMRKWFINLPDKDLAYFPEGTDHFNDYVEAVEWAQDFARENRRLMLDATLRAIETELGKPFAQLAAVIQCHHNYISRERHYGENVIVTRKGAVRAREGELGIIPGSMGAKSFIVRGKGNRESFESCSHGAGRAMSRTEAKRRFTVEDHAAATAGVECRKDAEVVDETPAAYKSIDDVMLAQRDLVEIVAELKQVLCVKG